MKEWTLSVYMAGDNNLSNFGLRDIEEMQQSGISSETNAVVEIDQAGDFDGTIRYEITEKDPRTGKADRIVKERLSERDSGDPQTLIDSLKWVVGNYAAQNNFVVIWNHGSGFRYMRTDRYSVGLRPSAAPVVRRGSLFRHKSLMNIWKDREGTRSIASDDMTGNALDMIELHNALRKAGFTNSKKISVLGFDACLMNLVEVAYEMSTHAKYLVGSEELEPGDGWPYALDLDSLNKLKEDDDAPLNLAKNFVKNYEHHYNKESMRRNWPVTQSAIDLDHVNNLAESIDRFASALSSVLPDGIQNISDIREQVQDYAPTYDFDDYADLGDLADLCKSNIENEEVVAAASDVLAELKKTVVAEIHVGDDVKFSHGLTIWFPETADKYHNHRGAYRKLAMTKRYKKWDGFLAKYHPRRPRGMTLERTEIRNR